MEETQAFSLFWQSPIIENKGVKEQHAWFQKSFKEARVLTQRHYQKQNECPHLAKTINIFKVNQQLE